MSATPESVTRHPHCAHWGAFEALVRDVTKIETATEPRFQEHFVTALAFPHSPVPGSTGGNENPHPQ